MALKADPAASNQFNAGDHVEVMDTSSKLFGKVGVVEFFVDDNIYVRFDCVRWLRTKMFFSDELRAVVALESLPLRSRTGALTLTQRLGHALNKITLGRKRSNRRLRQP